MPETPYISCCSHTCLLADLATSSPYFRHPAPNPLDYARDLQRLNQRLAGLGQPAPPHPAQRRLVCDRTVRLLATVASVPCFLCALVLSGQGQNFAVRGFCTRHPNYHELAGGLLQGAVPLVRRTQRRESGVQPRHEFWHHVEFLQPSCWNYSNVKKLAEKKGFYQLDKTHIKTENLELKHKEKEIIQEKIDTFDINYYSKVNDILYLSNEDAKDYAELYVEPHKLTHYLNRVSFFHKNRNHKEWKIKDKDDFKILKAQSTENKILFITDFIDTYSTNKSKIDFESLTNKTDDNINQLTFNKFSVLFRYRGKRLDLSIINNRIKCIKKMYIELFGRDFIGTKKVKVNNKTVNKWFIDKEILLDTVLLLEKHQDNLFDFNDDLKYIIGEENNMLKVKSICKIKDDDEEVTEIDTLEKRKGEIYKYFKRINI